jgi:hypothetical protein
LINFSAAAPFPMAARCRTNNSIFKKWLYCGI